MNLTTQRKLAAQLLKVGTTRVRFDEDELESISEAITKEDVRGLISQGSITKKPVQGVSRARANKRLTQRRKGRQKGPGTKKGTKNARLPRKEMWMNKIRSQRNHLVELKDSKAISAESYRDLYKKAGGGFFRSKRHINLYIDEHNMRNN